MLDDHSSQVMCATAGVKERKKERKKEERKKERRFAFKLTLVFAVGFN